MSNETKQQTGHNAWVEGFACAMVDGLNRNAHKGGRENWLKDHPKRLLSRVEDEFHSLMQAVEEGADPMTVWAKAASVANMAGMVADSYAVRQAGASARLVVKADPTVPPDEAHLRVDGKTLARITNLTPE